MNKEEILRLTNGGLDVFRHYVPGNWQVGKNFRNPFYADKNASFRIYLHPKTGGYCMVDGLADLISSANDEEEAVQIVEWAHRLAEQYQMVFICMVHTAGLPEKVRGHLGSELTRKASAVIDIEIDRKTQDSVVKPLKLRQGSVRRAGICRFGWCEKRHMHVFLHG